MIFSNEVYMSRYNVFFSEFLFWQSFHYSYFTCVCLFVLLLSQFPYVWSFSVIYIFLSFFLGLRPVGLALYDLICFLKILKLSFPTGLPSILFSFIITPFIFVGECSSQMIRPITLILRLLVNLTFAYLVSLLVGSSFIENLLLGCYFKFGVFFGFCFSIFYFFYEIFMCFLLTYVSHVMMLSLISDVYHVIGVD
uniref:ATPase subunit 6 n=1 Tax=Diplorchis hangzhouensis TaxID=1131906 RepID=A0A3G0WN01_9PLAT|nr:ATPase subunit 6 [Diplorchis hangzhouensis]